MQAAGLTCELSGGTSLGVLKFNRIAPWDIDADVQFQGKEYETFNKTIFPKMRKLGYKPVSHCEILPLVGVFVQQILSLLSNIIKEQQD